MGFIEIKGVINNMRIYIGSFDYVDKYIKDGLIPISIDNQKPSTFNGLESSYLKPDIDSTYKLKNGIMTEDEFEKKYIDNLDRNKVYKYLLNLKRQYNNTSVILLSKESNYQFSHRKIFAKYVKDNFNVIVSEYD